MIVKPLESYGEMGDFARVALARLGYIGLKIKMFLVERPTGLKRAD